VIAGFPPILSRRVNDCVGGDNMPAIAVQAENLIKVYEGGTSASCR
jgi:hypothetical protein